ncbi:PspA/IM30 family protein [Corynebacterium occultum]|uniref:PspA/IM30 family protein n=1 Tax=Corynebacterium occultum TaxID=2675219 RepID=A0A6B8W4W2_9CORY|nr:PspA/IM30 family protein [Corynebacterium occultum]QGU08604.1 PspA/IM30 family protein [Corynebacterium occultum]
MANPFSKGWKYLTASLDSKIDENADPKVQIQQATEAAKKQHQQITQHAAAIIGNKKQLEMKLDRLLASQKELQEQTRQALNAADQAAAQGDNTKSSQFNNTAEVFATQLVAVEQQIEGAKQQHTQAAAAAEQAEQQQKQSEIRLKEQLSQIDALRAQADQAAMQETATEAMDSMNALKPDTSVPTLDGVREKIERRYADALGAQELTQSTVGDRMAEIQAAGTDMKASARLAEIRAQMGGGNQLTAGEAPGPSEEASPEVPAEEKPDQGAPGQDKPGQDKPGAANGQQ